MNNQRLRELARKGLELERRELDLLERELKGGAGKGAVAQKPTARKSWTPEQRAAVSARMSAYWAKKKAGKAPKQRKAKTG